MEMSQEPSNFALYEKWYEEYTGAVGDSTTLESNVIRAVDADELDHDQIERHVQRLLSTTHVSHGFCAKCQYLLNHWPDIGKKDWDHATGRTFNTFEIEAATRLGCIFCAYLLSQLRESGLLDTFRRISTRLRVLDSNLAASLSIQSWGRNANPQLLWFNWPGKPLSLAKLWLDDCLHNHQRCRNKKVYALPTRLLSVGNNTTKLVETATLQTVPQYATLSYCWGSQQFTVLTTHNYDTFLRGIILESLPQTFQDAIHIARRLGLEFIWIDALCIIQKQDDNYDWLKESGRMQSVYGGACIGLAASTATSVYEGCSTKQALYSGGFCARVTTTEHCRVQNFHNLEVYEEYSNNTNLARRAWALQEKLLPARTIRFGVNGLFWECRSMIRSEFLPDGYPDRLGSHAVRPEDQAWDWAEIVLQYSGAKLTNGSDRLPALSGIANRQQEITNDSYLAGMWRERLIAQLCWSTCEPSERRNRPNLGVPSWSWASVAGQAFYWLWDMNEKEMKQHASVLDAWTTLAGPDPFGEVTYGEVSIRCSGLVGGTLQGTSKPLRGNRRAKTTETVLVETAKYSIPICLDCLDDVSVSNGDLVYLLAVLQGETGTQYGFPKECEYKPELTFRGIVLVKCDEENGFYHRVGSFDFEHEPKIDDKTDSCEQEPCYYHEFARVMERLGSSTAESDCAQFSSD
ncbi:heterokaryon incompatibility protein-domain-containing protein, partial [Xylariales sp. AK1849]